jgi:hypothetical protein
MLYIAFLKSKPGSPPDTDLNAKSRKWWNEGGKPAGLKTVGFYGVLSSNNPDVYVFESSNHDDIRTMIEYWRDVSFEVHPAVDMVKVFHAQGMDVS